MREIRDYLADIKIECEYLISRSKGLGYEEFIQNEELKKSIRKKSGSNWRSC